VRSAEYFCEIVMRVAPLEPDGGLSRPTVFHIRSRSSAKHAVQSLRAPPRNEAVAAEVERQPRRFLIDQIELRAGVHGPVIEEVGGRRIRAGRIERKRRLQRVLAMRPRSDAQAVPPGHREMALQLMSQAHQERLAYGIERGLLDVMRQAAAVI